MNIEQIEGLVFRASSGEEFGRIRPLAGSVPQELQRSNLQAFAQDECGNYFVIKNGAVAFWDHETSEVLELASSQVGFIASLVATSPVTLRQGQVKSVWVSSELANLANARPKSEP